MTITKMIKNINVDNALISNEIPCLAREYISTDNVENPFPVTKNVTAKSSSEYVKAIKNPANIPGVIYGKITFVKIFQFVAPRSRAASINDELISCNFGNTIITKIGTLKAICDRKTDVKLC